MAAKPGFLEGVYGTLFNPGGDVDRIRLAAGACRKLSGELNGRVEALAPVASGLTHYWQGKPADGFQASWTKFRSDLSDYATQMDTDAATSLDRVADMLHEAQVQARNAEIAIGIAVAACAAATVFTFGFSDVVGAAVVDTEVTALELFMARMAALLAGEAEAISALLSALATTIGRFLLGFVASDASSMLVKGLIYHQNVLDPANWEAKDFSKAILDGILVTGMGSVFSEPTLAAKMEAHPYLGFTLAGGGASAVFSTVSQFWLDHASLSDPESWFNVVKSTAVGATSGIGMAGLFVGVPHLVGSRRGLSAATAGPSYEQLRLFDPEAGGLGPKGLPLFPAERFPRTRLGLAVDGADVIRTGTGLGSDMINYMINYPRMPEGLRSPVAPPAGAVAPTFPVPPPALSHPPAPHLVGPTLGGGTHTVHNGDSLWEVARRVYGDGTRWTNIWAANPQITNPNLIHPGNVVALPELHAPRMVGAG
jgi:uncharacterized protein YukE